MQATENEELAHKAHSEIVRAASKLLDEGLPIGLVINAMLTEAFNLGQQEVTEEERKMRAAPAALAVNFQEVVHSIRTGNADVAKPQ